jgi:hypothetical protein
MAIELVPGTGDAVAVEVSTNAPVVTAMGPWPAGTFIDRIDVSVHLLKQTGMTGLRLGFALSSVLGRVWETFERAAKVWRPVHAAPMSYPYYRLELGSLDRMRFVVDVGVLAGTGSRYVLVYHDLDDGTDSYDLFVSVRTLVAREVPVVTP